ncbi:MAG: hypothetical protein ACREKK_08075 [Candidatus Methylomirabilales bacterium]
MTEKTIDQDLAGEQTSASPEDSEPPVPEGFEMIMGSYQVATAEAIEHELLASAFQELRQKVAAAKLQYQLATAGMPGMDHPNKIKGHLEGCRKALVRVESLIEAGEVPEPTALEVVGDKVQTPEPDGPSAA